MGIRTEPGAVRAAALSCALGVGWLALLWAACQVLPQLAPWQWLLAVAALAVLPAWGLWLGYMVRKRVLHAQFSKQGVVARWFSGGLWPACKATLWSLALCAAALWQAYFLSAWEWALLLAVPPLHALAIGPLQRRFEPQFAHAVFAWPWAQRAVRLALLLLLGGIWLGWWLHAGLAGREVAPAMGAPALDAQIARIAASPSALVRWGLDALLVLQVGGNAALDLAPSVGLRLLLLALTGPVGLLWCLGWAMQGATGTRRVRQALRPQGAAAARTQAAVAGAVAALATLLALQGTALLDGAARQYRSPLALQRLPQCERIGEHVYTVGTLEAARRLALDALGRSVAAPGFCAGIDAMRERADAAIEGYLDWYFSLAAEWGRIYHLLKGNPEQFLQKRLEQTLVETPGLDEWLGQVRAQAERGQAELSQGRRRVDEVLARHRLSVSPDRCLLQAQVAQLPALDLLGHAQARLTASAAGAVSAGFAGAIAGKAVAKTSMKAAAKVLAKAAAKQTAGKLGGALLGGAAGSFVAPGIGTAIGFASGLLVGTALDWAALHAEEALTRDDMRRELRAAVGAQFDTLAGALACTPAQ